MVGEKRVIMTKTPLRVSFAGGGTDIPEYYRNYGTGAVLSGAMSKYVHVGAYQYFFENSIRVHYAKVELDEIDVNKIQNPVIRESLKLTNITKGIEISTIADVPSRGTGLGSSSSFAVGLLNAIHKWKGDKVNAKMLAEEAIHIERNVLGEAGGKQDQYVAAFGGLLLMEFFRDDSVKIKRVGINKKDLRELEKHLLLMYTGNERSSATIQSKVVGEINAHLGAYKRMSELAYEQCTALENGNWRETGKIMHKNWNLKKTLTNGISDPHVDKIYNIALKNGAEGGKIMGAGGGGFMILFADPDKHQGIIEAIPEFRHEPFGFEARGSRVIYSQGIANAQKLENL